MADPLRTCELAFPGELRDRLVAAVLRGEKTGTSCLLAEYEHDGEALPEPGDHETVVDSAGEPVAVLELTAVEVLALGDVDLDFALAEGEGFTTVAEWRTGHERFWTQEVLPTLPADVGPLTDATRVVAQRFRLIDASA